MNNQIFIFSKGKILSVITMVGVIAMITELDQWNIYLDQDELNVCDYSEHLGYKVIQRYYTKE